MTGAVIGGEIWLACYRVPQPLSVANGAIVRIADAGSRFTMVVPHLLTANAAVDAVRLPRATTDRTWVLIFIVDARVKTLSRY